MRLSRLTKRLLLIPVFGGASWFVYADVGIPKSLNSTVSANWAVIGAPTFMQTGMPTSNTICMNTSNKTSGVNPSVGFNLNSTVSSSQLNAALNLGASGNLPILESFGITANANANFAASVANSQYTYNYTYLYTYTAETRLNTSYGNSNLNNDGLNAFNAGQNAFLQTCGNSFVSNLNAGVVLAVNVAVTLLSKEQAVAFSESADIALKNQSLNNITQSISASESTLAQNAVITVSAMQNGGTPEALGTALGGALSKPCQVNNVSNCQAMINDIYSYVSTISGQITSGGNLIESRLYYSNPSLQAYSRVGISVPAPEPLPDSVVTAQTAVINEINLSQNRINFLQNYLHNSLNLSSVVVNFINMQTQALQARINYIAKASVDCFNADALSCPAVFDRIQKVITNNSTYSFDEKYYDYLNTAIEYTYNGKQTVIVPVSWSGDYNTLAGGYPNQVGLPAKVMRTPGLDGYITEIDIPDKDFLILASMNKCVPLSDADKSAKSRTFTCTDGLFKKFNLQFQMIPTQL